ncbi:GGDEF domain-containing protein [Stakelama pacifica]|uniref:Diguanylate cyclase (GGDEF)-like protein n=1 Tax=Stakelama pacifica TaxID=517720 RepID=A0A4R6FUQ2_9SPHN|nr:GGDEF domain-containing protein [Stakelama pacifica]TDN85457.1 diguanylate cyclase (GGDEF)-like protein [Stakelama pacifica]
MPGTSHYVAPRSAILRWIVSIDPNLPPDVRTRLGAMFRSSPRFFVLAAVNSIAVLLVAFYRIGDPVLLALVGMEVALLAARLGALRVWSTRTDPFFVVGLAWAANQAAAIMAIVLSRDIAMTVIVLASSLAGIGGIIGRNFMAPRYAMAQVLMIDLSFKASFGYLFPQFLPLILCQGGMFVLLNKAMIKQHRRVTVRAIIAEIDSRNQAFHDPLTGLMNRRGFEGAFERMTAGAAQPALLYLDLDGFKQVNDRFGHHIGDLLLQEVGRRLTAAAGSDATVCRLGGDEFLVLVEQGSPSTLGQLSQRLIASIGMPYTIEPTVQVEIGVSIGVAPGCAAKELTMTSLMILADTALYAAKAAGKSQYVVYSERDGSEK